MDQSQVIEGGVGWINILIVATNVLPGAYLMLPIRMTILASTFGPLFANTPAEIHLFTRNNFSTVYPPVLLSENTGYNDGNLLLGW